LVKNLILIDSSKDEIVLENIPATKIFSFNLTTHEFLDKKNIEYEVADTFLNESERIKLFEYVIKCHDWYYKEEINKKFEYRGINILNSSDSVEFFSYVLLEAIKFFTIKNIIEKEKPQKIFADITLLKSLKHIVKKQKIDLEVFGKNKNQELLWDKITVKQNLGKIPISFTISRKLFFKIKNLAEFIICSMFSLWINPKKNQKDSVLFLEFNPSEYKTLFSNLDEQRNIILVNRRRPAIWSMTSIKTLLKNNCKLINFNNFISKKEKDELPKIINDYKKKVEVSLLESPNKFLFSDENLWPIVKETIIETYKKRIPEYIFFITAMTNFFEKINVKCIMMLNQLGETEKTVLKIDKNNVPSILLEHAFANYTKETSKFSILSSYPILKDKIAVWGEIQKKYLTDFHNVSSDRIFVTGSPRHDKFFHQRAYNQNKKNKTVLIAPHPITEITGQSNTKLYYRYEKAVKKICEILKEMNDVKVIVKLHPSQLQHNKLLVEIFKRIDSSIPIHLSTPTDELITSVDTVLTLSPEGMDPSTIILESLILEKPTMNIILDNHFFNFEISKSNAIISVIGTDNIREELQELIFNGEKRQVLIDNGKKFLNSYMNNQGNASENLAKIINEF